MTRAEWGAPRGSAKELTRAHASLRLPQAGIRDTPHPLVLIDVAHEPCKRTEVERGNKSASFDTALRKIGDLLAILIPLIENQRPEECEIALFASVV
uniref:Uncharacterized protein n=1 Tax=Knipowitschia caucasica TaxID=637954 RepID=A0AAV2KS02_KNICA